MTKPHPLADQMIDAVIDDVTHFLRATLPARCTLGTHSKLSLEIPINDGAPGLIDTNVTQRKKYHWRTDLTRKPPSP